jgi:hypothetical protein
MKHDSHPFLFNHIEHSVATIEVFSSPDLGVSFEFGPRKPGWHQFYCRSSVLGRSNWWVTPSIVLTKGQEIDEISIDSKIDNSGQFLTNAGKIYSIHFGSPVCNLGHGLAHHA